MQPRLPCFKPGIRFDGAGMVKQFLDTGRWGIYFRVLTPGTDRNEFMNPGFPKPAPGKIS